MVASSGNAFVTKSESIWGVSWCLIAAVCLSSLPEIILVSFKETAFSNTAKLAESWSVGESLASASGTTSASAVEAFVLVGSASFISSSFAFAMNCQQRYETEKNVLRCSDNTLCDAEAQERSSEM